MKPLTPEQAEAVRLRFVEYMMDADQEPKDFIDWLDENTRSFEPPTVVYKGSGFTGAQKDSR